jgi:hypothetical protein
MKMAAPFSNIFTVFSFLEDAHNAMKNDWQEDDWKRHKRNMTCARLKYFFFKYRVWCKLKSSVRSAFRTAVTSKITVVHYNLARAHTHILEEPATFLFQVREISSAKLHSITSQKKVIYQRKNPDRSSYKTRFIYEPKCDIQWQIMLQTKYVQVFLIP